MNIECLSLPEVNSIIQNNFFYYPSYKNWSDMVSDTGIMPDDFTVCYKFIAEILQQKELLQKLESISLPCTNKVHMLLVHDYVQKFPWFCKDYADDKLVSATIKYFMEGSNQPKKFVLGAHGFKCFGELSEIICRIFFLPYLQSYLDINILLFDLDILIKIDHHLTISIISKRNGTSSNVPTGLNINDY